MRNGKAFTDVERMIFLSMVFTGILIAVRIFFSERLMYMFLVWNLFLAVIPLIISRTLQHENSINTKTMSLLFVWLIFFPNAPYIITDVFHFSERPPVPKWFDLLIVVSAAWNGLIPGIISLMQVERFVKRTVSTRKAKVVVFISLMMSAFGIYVGRFLRFNSWDIITNPKNLGDALLSRLLYPFQHPRTWAFTLLFGCLLLLMYYTISKLVEARDNTFA